MPAQANQIWLRCHNTAGQTARLLRNLVYPPQCAFCKADMAAALDDIALCDECRTRLSPSGRHWCVRCGAPFDASSTLRLDCVHCRNEKFDWECAVALGRYRGELSRAVVHTKSQHHGPLTVALAQLLFDLRAETLRNLRADLVVPMPMHWARRIKRGANGPELIAEVLASKLDLQLRTRALRRKRLTRLQTETTPSQRHSNQRHSFRVAARTDLTDRRVLLVDDVLTTGATAHEAAQTLRSAGAAAVCVAVIARGIGEDAL